MLFNLTHYACPELKVYAGASMDIKKTSYKKLSKLLSTFEKKVTFWLKPDTRTYVHCSIMT